MITVQKNNYGMQIVGEIVDRQTDLAIDISAATDVFFEFTSPSGITKTLIGALLTNGLDGKGATTILSADILDEAQTWIIQMRIVYPAGERRTEPERLYVRENAQAP